MSKLVRDKKFSEMTDEEQRSAECFFATYAIRSAMRSWGPAWDKLDVETRKAYLVKAAVEYMCGQTWCSEERDGRLPRQRGVGWTAEAVWRVLEVCVNWSHQGACGMDLARMAAED